MRIKLRPKMALATMLAAATLIGLPAAVFAGYAPSDRQTYQCVTPDNCPGADHVTFNSFTNAPNYGDERAFFDGKDAGITGSGGYQDSISVHDSEEVVLRVYIHNNANPNAIGFDAATAHNTTMQVQLPTSEKTANVAAADISASNASPGTVSDTVAFTGASPFTLAFDESAPVQITYRPNGTGDYVTRTLPAAAFASPNVLNATFGDWHGCFNYAALVTMTVKVHMPTTPTPPPPTPTYTCNLLNVAADVDRKVKVTAFTTTATNGATFKDAVINWGDNTTPLTTNNAVGQAHQYAAYGTYTVTATAHFAVDGQDVTAGGIQCQKQVTFAPNTPPTVVPLTTPPSTPTPTAPTALVNTGPGSVATLFAAVVAAGAFAHRWMLSRRLSRQ